MWSQELNRNLELRATLAAAVEGGIANRINLHLQFHGSLVMLTAWRVWQDDGRCMQEGSLTSEKREADSREEEGQSGRKGE